MGAETGSTKAAGQHIKCVDKGSAVIHAETGTDNKTNYMWMFFVAFTFIQPASEKKKKKKFSAHSYQ